MQLLFLRMLSLKTSELFGVGVLHIASSNRLLIVRLRCIDNVDLVIYYVPLYSVVPLSRLRTSFSVTREWRRGVPDIAWSLKQKHISI